MFFHKELLGNFKTKRKIFSPHFGQNTGFHDDRDPREVDSKMSYTGMKNPQLGRLNGSPWSGHKIRNIPLARATFWQGFQSKSVFLQGWHREPRESAKGFFISPQLDPTIYFNHDLRGNWNYFLFCYEDKAIKGPWLHLPSSNPFEDRSDTESLTAILAFRESCIFLTPLCPVPPSSCKWDKTRMRKKCSPHVLELFRISPLQRVWCSRTLESNLESQKQKLNFWNNSSVINYISVN